MDSRLILSVERIQSSFNGKLVQSRAELELLVEGDTEHLAECLDFLKQRDAILLIPDACTVYHHENLVEAIDGLVRQSGPMTPQAINDALDLPNAITCETLGWLDRDGRVKLDDGLNLVTAR